MDQNKVPVRGDIHIIIVGMWLSTLSSFGPAGNKFGKAV